MNWLGLLGVIFVVAKVFGIAPVADWSWWIVLLPFYLGLAIILAVVVIGAMLFGSIYGGANLAEKYQAKKRRQKLEKEEVWRHLSNKD